MDGGEERHRAEAQRLTDSHSISTRLLKKQAVKIWKLAKFMSNFWPLVSVALGCFVYHFIACLHRIVQENMFGALPAVSADLWTLAMAYYVYERALVGRQGAYFMVSVLGLLIGYASGCERCCANFP